MLFRSHLDLQYLLLRLPHAIPRKRFSPNVHHNRNAVLRHILRNDVDELRLGDLAVELWLCDDDGAIKRSSKIELTVERVNTHETSSLNRSSGTGTTATSRSRRSAYSAVSTAMEACRVPVNYSYHRILKGTLTMFSPPRMIMSLARSLMKRKFSSSRYPISPLHAERQSHSRASWR